MGVVKIILKKKIQPFITLHGSPCFWGAPAPEKPWQFNYDHDDLDGKTTHFYWSLHTNDKGTKISKTSHSATERTYVRHLSTKLMFTVHKLFYSLYDELLIP